MIKEKQNVRRVYAVTDPQNGRSHNFDDRMSAWRYVKHVGADSVRVFIIEGTLVRYAQDQRPAFA